MPSEESAVKSEKSALIFVSSMIPWRAKDIELVLLSLKLRFPFFQLMMLAGFIILLGIPPFLDDPQGKDTIFSHFGLFANFMLWGVWFPLTLLSVILVGRLWCGGFCTMGASSEFLARLGLAQNIPNWLRNEWLPIISFLVITILGQTLGVREHPEAALEIFGGTMITAMFVGLLYGPGKRAWCRHLCPIGLLLGIFSRLGLAQMTPRQRRQDGDAYSQKGICPTFIDLGRKQESRHCIACMRCSTPGAKGGLALELRHPGAEIEAIRHHNANPIEVWFLFVGSGMALGGFLWLVLPQFQALRQLLGELAIAHEWLWLVEPGPAWLMSVHPERREVFLWIDFLAISGFMSTCAIGLGGVLAIATGLASYVGGRLGANGNFSQRFNELGYQQAPVALVSLLIGLGGAAFTPLSSLPGGVVAGKGLFLVLGLAWSLILGWRILGRQGLGANWRLIPLLPSAAASLLLAIIWGMAV
jgi:polyferredoxin